MHYSSDDHRVRNLNAISQHSTCSFSATTKQKRYCSYMDYRIAITLSFKLLETGSQTEPPTAVYGKLYLF